LPVRIGKENKFFIRQRVGTDGLDGYVFRPQFCCRGLNIVHGKGKMTQALCFGIAAPLAKVRKGEELNLVVTRYGKVQLVRLSFGPICLADNFKTQHFGIETLALLIIVCQDGDMVDGLYIHAMSPRSGRVAVFAALPILPRWVSWKLLKYFKPYPIALSMLECPNRIRPAYSSAG